MTTAQDDLASTASSADTAHILAWTKWSAGFAMWLCLALGLPTMADTANLVQLNEFPLGFYILAQAGPILLACFGIWLAAYTTSPGANASEGAPRSVGLVNAFLALTPALILFAAARIYTGGFDGLLIGHGIMAGIVLWILVRIRPAAPKQPSHWERRGTRGLAVLMSLALLPLAVSHVDTAVTLAGSSEILGLDRLEVIIAVVTMACVIALVAGHFGVTKAIGFFAFSAFCALIVLTGVFQVTSEAPSTSDFLVPQLTYGSYLSEIARLQRDLVIAERADPVTTRQFARPWTELDSFNGLFLVCAIAASVVVLLQAFSGGASNAHQNEKLKPTGQRAAHWLVFGALAVVITVPVIPVQMKHLQYAEIEQGVERTALNRWMDRATDNRWATLCTQPARSETRGAVPAADAETSTDAEDIPDWWLEDEPVTATDRDQTPAERQNMTPTVVSPSSRDVDALVSQYMVSNHICLKQGQQLSADDLTLQPMALLPIAATVAGARGVELLAIQAFLIAALVVGLASLLIVLQNVAGSIGKPIHVTGAAAQVALAVLIAGLAITLPGSGLSGDQLPVWTFALLSGAVAPAVVISRSIAHPHSEHGGGRSSVAMAMGFVLAICVIAYLLATSILSGEFASLLAPFSNAPGWKLQNLSDLQSACLHLGSDACTAARELSRQTTNIAGIRPEAVGPIIGLLAAMPVWITMLVFRMLK